jgi:hypothetical protein
MAWKVGQRYAIQRTNGRLYSRYSDLDQSEAWSWSGVTQHIIPALVLFRPQFGTSRGRLEPMPRQRHFRCCTRFPGQGKRCEMPGDRAIMRRGVARTFYESVIALCPDPRIAVVSVLVS